jgi:hypothetical protein
MVGRRITFLEVLLPDPPKPCSIRFEEEEEETPRRFKASYRDPRRKPCYMH